MLLVLALATSAHANATFADVSVSGESPVDGTCAVTLEVTADDHVYIFDDAGALSFNTIRWYLIGDGDPCELVDLGSVYYEICGDADVDGDGDLVWSVDFEAADGESGTWLVTDVVSAFGDATTLAAVDWSCGECDLSADINGDGQVGWQDYVLMGGFWGQAVDPGNSADLDGDDFVNTSDLLILLSQWGMSC